MKAITKRFLAVFLSLFLIIAPTIQQANAASDWSVSNAVSAGSRTIVTATKGGYKSAVNIAPTAGRLALKLGKGANWAALVYAAIQLAPDLADIDSFKPQYGSNEVEYKMPGSARYSVAFSGKTAVASTPLAAASASCALAYPGGTADFYYSQTRFACFTSSGLFVETAAASRIPDSPPTTESISIPAAAAQVAKNAAAGHAPSQEAVRQAATEMVVAGDFDKDLLAGAVPINDSRPLVPAVPISGNGNVAVGDTDAGMTGGDVGQAADDARKAADDARKAAQAASDAAKAAAEDARKAADDAADLVNSGADAAAVAAAEAAKAEAAKAAADAKAVSDAAVAAANERAAAAERAAEAATQAAQAAATQAAADLAAAQAAGDAAAIAAAEAAKAAAAAELAAAKEKQAAAEKAAEKAKAEAAKPFELPAFCDWAAIVCETAEWLKREPETPEITAIDTDSPIDDFDSDKSYITFTGSCPPKYTASLSIMGATAPFEFDYTPICTVMSYLKPFIVGAGYIAAAYIIAGHSRGSKD